MIYWHGSRIYFRYFDIRMSRMLMDFGPGIYLAESRQHALSMATRYGRGFLYKYKVNLTDIRKRYNVKEFRSASLEWTKFVVANRSGNNNCDFDLVIGPTADANALGLVDRFIRVYGRNAPDNAYMQLRNALKTNVYPNQICVKNLNLIREFDLSRIGEEAV